MTEDDGQPLSTPGPATTSAGRFFAASAAAAIASVSLPVLVIPILIMTTGSREAGMGIGASLGVVAGWIVFPLVAWPPFRALQLLVLPAGFLAAFAGFTILPESWLRAPAGDLPGLPGAVVNYVLCSLAVCGGLTWLRNRRLRAGTPPRGAVNS